MSSKIGFIITNLRGGGAEKAILKLAKTLGERGCTVHLILLEDRVDYPLDGQFTVHKLKKGSRGFLGKRLTALRLRMLLARLEPLDLVVSTLPFADEIAKLAKPSQLWHRIANNLSAELESLKKTSPAKAKRRLKRYARLYGNSRLIAVSQGVAEDLKGLFPKATVKMIPNAFDVDAIQEMAKIHDTDIPKEPYLIHVGRFVPQKRHDLLFEALKLAKRPEKLVLLTTPSVELQALIDQFGLAKQVIVCPFRTNPYPLIANARLLVLSSDREGLPNVLIEALICHTPVVSTDCPSGPREILQQPLVPCGDAAALAKALVDALNSPAPLSHLDLTSYLPSEVASKYEVLCNNRK